MYLIFRKDYKSPSMFKWIDTWNKTQEKRKIWDPYPTAIHTSWMSGCKGPCTLSWNFVFISLIGSDGCKSLSTESSFLTSVITHEEPKKSWKMAHYYVFYIHNGGGFIAVNTRWNPQSHSPCEPRLWSHLLRNNLRPLCLKKPWSSSTQSFICK